MKSNETRSHFSVAVDWYFNLNHTYLPGGCTTVKVSRSPQSEGLSADYELDKISWQFIIAEIFLSGEMEQSGEPTDCS